jgi:hypothetical protein
MRILGNGWREFTHFHLMAFLVAFLLMHFFNTIFSFLALIPYYYLQERNPNDRHG